MEFTWWWCVHMYVYVQYIFDLHATWSRWLQSAALDLHYINHSFYRSSPHNRNRKIVITKKYLHVTCNIFCKKRSKKASADQRLKIQSTYACVVCLLCVCLYDLCMCVLVVHVFSYRSVFCVYVSICTMYICLCIFISVFVYTHVLWIWKYDKSKVVPKERNLKFENIADCQKCIPKIQN